MDINIIQKKTGSFIEDKNMLFSQQRDLYFILDNIMWQLNIGEQKYSRSRLMWSKRPNFGYSQFGKSLKKAKLAMAHQLN